MALIQLWEQTPDIILQYNIKQIVSAAGDGVLKDGSECSKELLYFLNNAPTDKLFEHIEYCLANSFNKSGIILQDIINELGRRLDYEVEGGLYQGRSNKIGFDGIWEAPDGHAIVIEVKTTDAYRINLDTVAKYRDQLIESGRITNKSSILVVVGRNDTGDLEAQIRGSRHAWDARIISAEALMKLVELKLKSDEDETIEKIRSLLVPFEYTRLDNIIDVMFTTAKDVETAEEEEQAVSEQKPANDQTDNKQDHTPKTILEQVRIKALEALRRKKVTIFIKHKRTQFWSGDKKIRATCLASKKYESGGYWYGLRPHQLKFISETDKGYLVLGCVDSDFAFAIPAKKMEEVVPYLNVTDRDDRYYWHLHIELFSGGEYQLTVPNKDNLDLGPYQLSVT